MRCVSYVPLEYVYWKQYRFCSKGKKYRIFILKINKKRTKRLAWLLNYQDYELGKTWCRSSLSCVFLFLSALFCENKYVDSKYLTHRVCDPAIPLHYGASPVMLQSRTFLFPNSFCKICFPAADKQVPVQQSGKTTPYVKRQTSRTKACSRLQSIVEER